MKKRERPKTNVKSFLDVVVEKTPEVNQVEKKLAIDLIVLSQAQPRRYFDLEALQSLSESLKQHGFLQPLLVRPSGQEKYELVAGERRYRAAKAAGITEVPVTIKALTDEQAKQMALIENLQREDLNPVEETEGILQLLCLSLERDRESVKSLLSQMKHAADRSGHNVMPSEKTSVLSLFDSLGKMTWESFVKNRLPILNLPKELLEAVNQGQIEYTKAKTIAKVKEEAARKQLLSETIDKGLSLSQIRERLKARPSSNKENRLSSPKQRFDEVLKRARQAKIWNSPSKWEKVSDLLNQIEQLLED